VDPPLRRTTAFMTHPVFNTQSLETQMMGYIRQPQSGKDIGLEHVDDRSAPAR